MNKINWKTKLSSRKFWAMLIAVASALLVLFGVEEPTRGQIIALIAEVGALSAYIVGEGIVDAANKNTSIVDK